MLSNYKEIEQKLQDAILQCYGMPPMDDMTRIIIKGIDKVLVNLEGSKLLRIARWAVPVESLGLMIEELTPAEARTRFMRRFAMLMQRTESARG